MDFDSLANSWIDTPDSHEAVLIAFDALCRSQPQLNDHRNWTEENAWGFGHRSFNGVWLLLARTLPSGFKFLEVGIHRGQSLSAVDLAANVEGKTATVVGLGPLNGVGGYYELRDYEPDVKVIFDRFNDSRYPTLIRGLSSDPQAIITAATIGPYDALYVDADHTLEATRHDLRVYCPMVKVGGYLFTDDSACNLNLTAWNFRGFEGASNAVDELLPPKTANSNWRYVTNAMHLRVWQRLS